MRQHLPQTCKLYLLLGLLLILASSVKNVKTEDTLLPEISPNSAPEPFLPLLAPSPWAPFTNSSVPKLSGQCTLNFDKVETLMSTTAMDCVEAFAPYLANIICCPQLEATLVIIIGQSSKDTNTLALNETLATHCLKDFQQILVGQGANDGLSKICSIHPLNLTESSCPVKDVSEFESTVDSSNLLASCGKINLVNECCEQVCQNAISEAAQKLALKGLNHLTRVNDCKSIVLRWLASKLDPSHAKQVLRGLSNCRINKVCPLSFPSMTHVVKDCANVVSNYSTCCNAMNGYVSHLQKQSFTTNLQALNCASSLGLRLQKANVTKNIYNLCHISLKDFSLQVGSQESGCLLPSLPSDVVFDQSVGISFLCDLNDNIPAPWPSLSQISSSSCNKTIKIPALPAAASGQTSLYSGKNGWYLLLSISVGVHMILLRFDFF